MDERSRGRERNSDSGKVILSQPQLFRCLFEPTQHRTIPPAAMVERKIKGLMRLEASTGDLFHDIFGCPS